MSGSLWWSPPPVEPEREGAETHTADRLLADLLFDGDTSTSATHLLEPTEPAAWMLRGALRMAERLSRPASPAAEVADDLRRLLKVVDTHGSAVVRVTRD